MVGNSRGPCRTQSALKPGTSFADTGGSFPFCIPASVSMPASCSRNAEVNILDLHSLTYAAGTVGNLETVLVHLLEGQYYLRL